MKPIIKNLIILLISCSFSSFLIAQGVQSFDVSGLKVILKETTANDIVSANIYFKGGVTNLNENQAGLEALTLTVGIKASQNYLKDKLNAELEKMNTILTTGSNVDYSSINLLCTKQNLEKSWNVFADVIMNPSFEEQDLSLERERLIAAVNQVNDNPDAYLQRIVNDQFYVDHPYSVEVNGTEETLSSFSVSDLKNYYLKLLNTSQMLLVVVGNTTKEELESMTRNSFSNIPKGNYVAQRPPMVVNSEPSVKVVYRELPTNYIQGSFSAPERGTPEGYTMLIANSILRDRVWEEVRTKRSLSYAPSSFYRNNFSNYGAIYVTAVAPDTTVKVMIHELQKMKDDLIPEKELHNKIRQFLTFYYLGNETNQSQANGLAAYELAGFGYQEAANFINNVNKVTSPDIQAVAQKYMKNLQFVLIGNPTELEIGSFMY